MTTEESKELFRRAIDSIDDIEIRYLVEEVYHKSIPDYFYTIPSSSSGKYHPEDELGVGGLVLHTLKCVAVADTMSRIWQLSSRELDLAKAALLLHDTCKNGVNTNSGHTEFTHPLLAAKNIINTFIAHYDKVDLKNAKKVAKLISSHMGQWNTNSYELNIKLPLPKTKLQKFVHECDYIASRKEFSITINGVTR